MYQFRGKQGSRTTTVYSTDTRERLCTKTQKKKKKKKGKRRRRRKGEEEGEEEEEEKKKKKKIHYDERTSRALYSAHALC